MDSNISNRYVTNLEGGDGESERMREALNVVFFREKIRLADLRRRLEPAMLIFLLEAIEKDDELILSTCECEVLVVFRLRCCFEAVDCAEAMLFSLSPARFK